MSVSLGDFWAGKVGYWVSFDMVFGFTKWLRFRGEKVDELTVMAVFREEKGLSSNVGGVFCPAGAERRLKHSRDSNFEAVLHLQRELLKMKKKRIVV